jgi:hypothetical protein
MNPLTFVLALLSATTVTGPALVAAFSLGLYHWLAVSLALALGLFAAAALARPIEDAIKRQDPVWDEVRDRPRSLPRRNGRAFDPCRDWQR